jgi:lipopolysaccharide biosynthesis protein
LKEKEALIAHLQAQVQQREQALLSITQSRGWALLQSLWAVKRRFSGKKAGQVNSADNNGEAAFSRSHLNGLGKQVSENNEPAVARNPVIDLLPELIKQNRKALARLPEREARLIAFYLPQFHPIPENDLWWGKGFTEWANVAKARPNFAGHYQPHLPADLGFYDLRVSETREQQAELAREYGVHGFCYYHYWFGGKRLLHRPFDEVLSSGRPDFPFCICWANENWTRRWDGLESEILIAQNHSDEDDRNFIRSLFPAFRDHRYIRVNGKPLLIVYRAGILPDAARTLEIWREECLRSGMGEIYLCATLSFGLTDPRPYGFDAAVEFPPLGMIMEDKKHLLRNLSVEFKGQVYDYLEAAMQMINKPAADYTLFKAAIPSWDNTPRRQHHGHIFYNASPEVYEYWLGKIIEQTITRNQGDERLVFVNAWNEWGEGAHLEPDRKFGHEYLAATRRALGVVGATSNVRSER